MTNAEFDLTKVAHPFKALLEAFRAGRQFFHASRTVLYITQEGKPEGVLRRADPNEKGFDELTEQRDRWIHNGPPEFKTAKYRIGII